MLRLNTSHYFYHFLLWPFYHSSSSFLSVVGPDFSNISPLPFVFGSFLFKSCFFTFSFPFVHQLLPLHPPFMAITHFSASEEEQKPTLIPSIKTSPTVTEWKMPLGCFSVHPAVDLQICSFAGSWLGCTRCMLGGQHTTACSSFAHLVMEVNTIGYFWRHSRVIEVEFWQQMSAWESKEFVNKKKNIKENVGVSEFILTVWQ